MILSFICTPFLLFINSTIALLPSVEQIPDWIMSAIDMLRTATVFIPVDVWLLVLSNVFFWISAHALVGILRFIKSIIPII